MIIGSSRLLHHFLPPQSRFANLKEPNKNGWLLLMLQKSCSQPGCIKPCKTMGFQLPNYQLVSRISAINGTSSSLNWWVKPPPPIRLSIIQCMTFHVRKKGHDIKIYASKRLGSISRCSSGWLVRFYNNWGLYYRVYRVYREYNYDYNYNLGYITGGNSNIFYFHPEPWGNDPTWRAYFSNGLVQPPTSHVFFFCGGAWHGQVKKITCVTNWHCQ